MPNRNKFIQKYFCINPIIGQLRTEQRFQIITSNYSGIKNGLSERRILYRHFCESKKAGAILLEKIKNSRGIEWKENVVDLASHLYQIIFNVFHERSFIEKYMGPLDGKNVARNVDFINHLAGA